MKHSSGEHLEAIPMNTDETPISMDSHLISLKTQNFKKTFYWDILKIVVIFLISMVFLVSNYALDQKSVTDISNIYTHLHYLHYRPVCVRFNLLTLINQIYDKNDCNCDGLKETYQKRIFENEEIIFQTDLPWSKLSNYYMSFQQINYHDLCVGVFEAQNEFEEILGN